VIANPRAVLQLAVLDVAEVDVNVVTLAAAVRSNKAECFIPANDLASVFNVICAQLFALLFEKGADPGEMADPPPSLKRKTLITRCSRRRIYAATLAECVRLPISLSDCPHWNR